VSSRLRAIARARALHALAKRTDHAHEAAAATAAAEEIARRYRLSQADTTAEETEDAYLFVLGVAGDTRRVWPLGLLLVLANFFRVTTAFKSTDVYGIVDDPLRKRETESTCNEHRALRLEVARQGGLGRLYGMSFVRGLALTLDDPYVTAPRDAEGKVVTAMLPASLHSEEARAAMEEIATHAASAVQDGAMFDAPRGLAHGQRVGRRLLRERGERSLESRNAKGTP
jgi:hypothetical protein